MGAVVKKRGRWGEVDCLSLSRPRSATASPPPSALFPTHMEKNADGVAAADGILGALQVALKGGGFLCLNEGHALAVEGLDALMDGTMAWWHVRVAKALAPVAEIGADDKGRLRVLQVRRQPQAILGRAHGGEGADQDRHEDKVPALHDVRNVGQMHLQAVLILVRALVHDVKAARVMQRFGSVAVDGDVAHGRGICGVGCHCAAGEIDMMGRPQQEDAADAGGVELWASSDGRQM